MEEKILTDKRQHRAYRGKVRGKVEHVFAWHKNWRQRFQIPRIGLVRAGFAIGMNTLIDHMRRLVFLPDKAID